MATKQITLNDAEFEQFRSIKDCPNCRGILVVRPVKRQPTGGLIIHWDQSAEVGDKVMYMNWPCYLRESRGRNKASLGVLTPVPVKCPFGKVGDVVQLNVPNNPYANVSSVSVKRIQDISLSDAKRLTGNMKRAGKIRLRFIGLWNSLNKPYRWEDNPYVWCVVFRN